jgi:prolyl-tRNA synthetase
MEKHCRCARVMNWDKTSPKRLAPHIFPIAEAESTSGKTSWGFTTRSVGGMIMTHGDDAGLCVPPAVAPIQVVVMVVRDDIDARERAAKIADSLASAGHRVKLDDRTGTSFGRRAAEWGAKRRSPANRYWTQGVSGWSRDPSFDATYATRWC